MLLDTNACHSIAKICKLCCFFYCNGFWIFPAAAELEQKSALNKRQEKELAKLRKERQEEQNFHSLDDAVELLTAEGYSVTKNDGSSCLTNEGILNVLSYRYDRIKDEKKKRELEEKIKTHFPSLFETAGNKTEETDKNIR